MIPNAISPCIVVADTQPAREFYPARFGAKIIFDCGWYLNMEFGKGGPTLQFMEPKMPEQTVFSGGLTYNLRLANTDEVDAKHVEVTAAGLPVIMPLEDHDWGDRGFCTLDPYGVAVYVYADIEPTDEFKQYYVK